MRLGHKTAGRGALHWRNSSLVGGAGFSGLWLQGPQDTVAGDGLLVVGWFLTQLAVGSSMS